MPTERNLIHAVAWTLLGACLFFLSFPPFDFAGLAYVALAPLLIATDGCSPRRALLLGWLYATVGCSAAVSTSIYEASLRYFHYSAWLRMAFTAAVPQIYAAPYVAVFAWAAAVSSRRAGRSSARVLVVASAWVASEYGRVSVGHGAPWLLLGHTQHGLLPMIQIADLAGVFGVSFVVAVVNAAVAELWLAGRGIVRAATARRSLAVAATVVGVSLLYGVVQLKQWDEPDGESIRIAVVQGDIPLEWRSRLVNLPRALRRMEELTRSVGGFAADLVIWPENSIGFAAEANDELFRRIARAIPSRAMLLVGAPRSTGTSAAGSHFYNSAFLITPGGEVAATYDKIQLTPFAEYVPWPIDSFSAGGAYGTATYESGSRRTVFPIKASSFSVLICYEAIYADIARSFVRAGAELLVNISNDDWFAGRPALQQHLIGALFRAVEFRRFLVRATNSGLTVLVTPTGRVAESLPQETPATMTGTVVSIDHRSPYSRWGGVFAVACLLVSIVSTGNTLRDSRRARRTNHER